MIGKSARNLYPRRGTPRCHQTYNVGPPSDVRWFINPMNTIVIGTINHSYWSYLHQLNAISSTGAPGVVAMDNPHGEFIGNIIQEWVIKNGDFPALPCLMTPEGKNNDWLVVEPTPLKKI